MANAAGSKTYLQYVAESVYGTTPGTPAMVYLRLNTTTLGLSKQTFTSAEIRSDRAIADLRHGNKSVQGDIVTDFTYGTYDDLLAAALGGAWSTDVVKQGVTAASFTLERGFTDITKYLVFPGSMVNTLAIAIKPNAIVTATFGMIGKTMTIATSPLDASPTAAPTNSPFDSFTGSLKEGGSTIAIVSGLDISLNNGISQNFVLMSDSVDSLTMGRSTVTGTITAYFPDTTMLAKFVDETESSIEVTLQDPQGNSYDIVIPRVKYTGGDVPLQGEGPITLSLPFAGLYDSTSSTDMQITRTPHV